MLSIRRWIAPVFILAVACGAVAVRARPQAPAPHVAVQAGPEAESAQPDDTGTVTDVSFGHLPSGLVPAFDGPMVGAMAPGAQYGKGALARQYIDPTTAVQHFLRDDPTLTPEERAAAKDTPPADSYGREVVVTVAPVAGMDPAQLAGMQSFATHDPITTSDPKAMAGVVPPTGDDMNALAIYIDPAAAITIRTHGLSTEELKAMVESIKLTRQ